MSFEYIVQQEEKPRKLDDNGKSDVAKRIVNNFTTYNQGRDASLKESERLIDEIFFKNKKTESNPKKQWKANIKMGKLFMFYQTLKAFIWKNIYSNMNSMFDVSGENEESDNIANKQKAMLVDIFEKMEYQKQADQIIDNSLFYGELISFTAWKTKLEERRRPIKFWETLFSGMTGDFEKLQKILKAKSKGKKYWIDEVKIYDNPYIYSVNPADFAFDTTQMDDWDSCPKIYKTYKTPDDIINNKYYTVSKDVKEAIKKMIADPDQSELADQSKATLSNNEKNTNGDTVEVLEHWGTLKLADGTQLKNWHAVVVGGQYLVRFAKNESVINPFTFGTYISDPKTKRGISILIAILELALTQEDLLNRTYNMQALNENPPTYIPRSEEDDGDVELSPGMRIPYGDGINPKADIIPMQFNSNIFLSDLTFLSDLMSEVSGIFPNMAGADEKGDKTATEISTKTQGQMTRLSMFIDIINQYLIVPDVKNVAKLCANFKAGIEKLFINKDNKKEVIEVDDTVRQADYKYTYSDRSATAERLGKADMIVQSVREFAQFIPLNIKEIFTWYFEQKGVENPERFLAETPQLPQGQQPNQPPMGDGTVPQVISEDGIIPQTPEAA